MGVFTLRECPVICWPYILLCAFVCAASVVRAWAALSSVGEAPSLPIVVGMTLFVSFQRHNTLSRTAQWSMPISIVFPAVYKTVKVRGCGLAQVRHLLQIQFPHTFGRSVLLMVYSDLIFLRHLSSRGMLPRTTVSSPLPQPSAVLNSLHIPVKRGTLCTAVDPPRLQTVPTSAIVTDVPVHLPKRSEAALVCSEHHPP